MPVTAPPKRKQDDQAQPQADAKTERKIKEVINRGGGVPVKPEADTEPTVKIVNVSLTTPEVAMIAALRDCRPKDARSKRKTPISLHAWLVEAAQEKIEREKKKYGI
ncbi:hypothetical protein [Spirosoma pomorum]